MFELAAYLLCLLAIAYALSPDELEDDLTDIERD